MINSTEGKSNGVGNKKFQCRNTSADYLMLPSYITWMVTALSALNAVFLLRHYRDWTEPVQSSWIAVPRLTRYSASDEQQLTLHELTPSLIIQCNTHLPWTHRIARPGTRCPRCTGGSLHVDIVIFLFNKLLSPDSWMMLPFNNDTSALHSP